MNLRRALPALLVAGAIGIGALTWASTRRAPDPVFPRDRQLGSDASALRAPYDPQLVQRNLEFWAEKTGRDKIDAISRAQLAHWYLESYRETGDSADIMRAEQAARASLKIRPTDGALIQLARALLNQHRFVQALVAAQQAALVNPDGTRLVADIRYEIGDYAAAEKDAKQAPPPGRRSGVLRADGAL